MIKSGTIKRVSTLVTLVCFGLATVGCGTILYPERRGQTNGRIDVGVAVLDGIGLLLFIIPGVVAYIVDFSTGAIYLPGGSAAIDGDTGISAEELELLGYIDGEITHEKVEAVLSSKLGHNVNLDAGTLLVKRLDADADATLASPSVAFPGGELDVYLGKAQSSDEGIELSSL